MVTLLKLQLLCSRSRVDSDSDVIFDDGSSAGSTSSHVDESSSSGATKVQKSPPKPAAPLHTQFMYIQVGSHAVSR